MEVINKYKHYLLLLAALMLIKMILVPLYDNQLAMQQTLKNSEKRINKIERLVSNKEPLFLSQNKLQEDLVKIDALLFSIENEATFKITAQSLVEKTLKLSGCNIEQVGWNGKKSITPKLNRWLFKARYKGDSNCLLKATRNLENLQPLVRIQSFYYGGIQIEKKPNSIVTARIELVMWQHTEESS